MLEAGDVLVVAGKGHETGQTVGHEVLPFSDAEAVAAATREIARMIVERLWSGLGLVARR